MRVRSSITDSYLPELAVLAIDLPVVFQIEGQEHMGETPAHSHALHTAFAGLLAHFSDKQEYRVFANLSLYYHPVNRGAFISPDIMVVCPSRPLEDTITSYRIGEDGPAPLIVVEVIGRQSLHQHDLTVKPMIYAQLGVKELLSIDTTGIYLPEKLQLRRLQFRDETWSLVPMSENGYLQSAFGYAITIEADRKLRLSNPNSKQPYPRLEETHDVITAWSVAMETLAQARLARRQADEHITQLKLKLRRYEQVSGNPIESPPAGKEQT